MPDFGTPRYAADGGTVPTIIIALRDWIRATPHVCAVQDERRSLTYADLGQRAEAVGVALREAGVRKGQIVVLALDDPVDMVVAMVGTLLAGAAYLAIDRE